MTIEVGLAGSYYRKLRGTKKSFLLRNLLSRAQLILILTLECSGSGRVDL